MVRVGSEEDRRRLPRRVLCFRYFFTYDAMRSRALLWYNQYQPGNASLTSTSSVRRKLASDAIQTQHRHPRIESAVQPFPETTNFPEVSNWNFRVSRAVLLHPPSQLPDDSGSGRHSTHKSRCIVEHGQTFTIIVRECVESFPSDREAM